jgi:hypothetical protein
MGVYYPVRTEDSWQWPLLASGEEILPRPLIGTQAVTMPSGRVRLTYFTARKSEVITSVRTFTNTTMAAPTPSLCKVGIYSIDRSTYDATLVTATANTTSLWNNTNTEYTTALLAPFAKTARRLYAFATVLVTVGAAPTLCGLVAPGALGNSGGPCSLTRGVPLGGYVSDTDLPATIAYATLVGSQYHPYGELVP